MNEKEASGSIQDGDAASKRKKGIVVSSTPIPSLTESDSKHDE